MIFNATYFFHGHLYCTPQWILIPCDPNDNCVVGVCSCVVRVVVCVLCMCGGAGTEMDSYKPQLHGFLRFSWPYPRGL